MSITIDAIATKQGSNVDTNLTNLKAIDANAPDAATKTIMQTLKNDITASIGDKMSSFIQDAARKMSK
ncbi:hypothetical protein ACFL4D_02655 [Candidatus Margulisiibacteriota bacterium]